MLGLVISRFMSVILGQKRHLSFLTVLKKAIQDVHLLLLGGNRLMIKENYEKIKKEVGDSAHIIAVTKYHSVEETLEAYEAGVRHFGVNMIDGVIEKRKALTEDAEVHFIGTMQSRKVKDRSE